MLQEASFAAGFSCSPSGALLIPVEGPNFGISLMLLLFPSLVGQGQEAAWVKVGGGLRISAPCSGVSWDDATFVTRQVGKAETCLFSKSTRLSEAALACPTVSGVGLSKSDLRAHLLMGQHCSCECCSGASCWDAFRE